MKSDCLMWALMYPPMASNEENHSDIIAKLIYAAKRIAKEQGLEGYKLVFNVGKEGGQMIDHLHLHLLGGWGAGVEKRVEV